MTMNSEKRGEGRGLDQEFYIRITEPVTFRRSLLEASKGTLGILRELYSVKQTREKKQEKTALLHREFKELKMLVQKLEEMLPDYTKADIKKHFPEFAFEKKAREMPLEEKHERKAAEKKPAPPKPASEIDKLSSALSDIQKKLSSL
jgi:hypothetical protein